MNYKIVSDSSSNVYALEDTSYSFVPLTVSIGNKEYADTPETDTKEVVNILKTTGLYSSNWFKWWLPEFILNKKIQEKYKCTTCK